MEDTPIEDDSGSSDMLDPILHLELQSLKLKQLEVLKAQLECQERVIMLKQAEQRQLNGRQGTFTRCILPDGRIVVRNSERVDSRETDVPCSSRASDTRSSCVKCGNVAGEWVCQRCGVTPYCSELCQRHDWAGRHKDVCHNLARDPALAPLRRPQALPQNDRESQPLENAAISKKSHFGGRNNMKKQPDKYKKNGGQRRGRDPPRNQSLPNDDEDWTTAQATPTPAPQYMVPNFTPATAPAAVSTPVPAEKPKPAVPATPPAVPLAVAPATPPAVAPAAPPAVQVAPAAQAGIAPVKDVVPVKKLVPESYLVDKLSVGDTFLVSVQATASECRQPRGDYVCLTMHERYEADYQKLCEDYLLDCDNETEDIEVAVGAACSYRWARDGCWYRARRLGGATLALLDAHRLVALAPQDRLARLPPPYEPIPEFCAALDSEAAKLGMNLRCTITSKTQDTCHVAMVDVDTGAIVGDGDVTRWLPTVDYCVSAPSSIPEVARPPVTNGSNVILVDVSALDKVYVRPTDIESQRRYNDILQQVILCGMKCEPLSEPPVRGQLVLGKFSDGIHYRALCRRTNVAKNRYQLEYIEFGNLEIQKLEDIYPCPSALDLESVPTVVSHIVLATTNTELTQPAKDLIEVYKDSCEELTLTLPNNAPSAPSGAEASLTVAKNRQSFSKNLIDLCTPEWKKMENNHRDLLDVPCIMFDQLKFPELPPAGCVLEVTDVSLLLHASICGYDSSLVRHEEVYEKLEKKIQEYVNSDIGKEPYLPRPEELCIAKQPDVNKWRRAVVVEQIGGPGGKSAFLLFFDYGPSILTPVADIRKMLPEFCTVPAMTIDIEIKNFPTPATAKQLDLAKNFMAIDQNSRGKLEVKSCVKQDSVYTCEAPDLIKYLLDRA